MFLKEIRKFIVLLNHKIGNISAKKNITVIDEIFLKLVVLINIKRTNDKTDLDVIREEIRFVWDESDDASTWEKRLAKRYYDKLFKEYCICDLSLYKLNKVAMRWRIEKEVIEGKGQFICGNKKCNEKDGLKSWEVNFAYNEHGEKKNALVKLRLCADCSYKLNYHHKKKEVTKKQNETLVKVEKTQEDSNKKDEYEETPLKKQKLSTELDDTQKEQLSNDGNMIIVSDDSIWKTRDQQKEEKTREDEFEDYLEDLLL